MAPLIVQVVDVGPQGLGDAQTVERQQGDERVIAGRAQPGLDQQSPQIVAVQPQSARFAVDLGAAQM
jgi:hypothetical protein